MSDSSQISGILESTVAYAGPMLWAGCGELVSQRAGVINIELEGMMLAGAFASAWATYMTGNLLLGIAAGAACGVLVAAIQGIVALVAGANQVLSGILLYTLVLGGTTVGGILVTGGDIRVTGLGNVAIPGLSKIPIVGPALFDQNWMVYALVLAVVALWLFSKYARTWLKLGAVGERPTVADGFGIRVNLVRWAVLIFCGAMAGLGGAQFTLGTVGVFSTDVTAGIGYIALAAVVVGGWRIGGVVVAIVVFGAAEAIGVRAQVLHTGIPYEVYDMLPYLVTVIATALRFGRSRPPAALGKNYRRGELLA
ncbi:MAG: ABC transporter permease [Acidimicrobiales bacterium]